MPYSSHPGYGQEGIARNSIVGLYRAAHATSAVNRKVQEAWGLHIQPSKYGKMLEQKKKPMP